MPDKVKPMKKIAVIALFALMLAGCQGRAIWNDGGKVEEATTDREVWDSNDKLDTGGRRIWNDREGNPVIQ